MEESQGNRKSRKINCSCSEFMLVFLKLSNGKPRAMNDLHGA